MRTKNKIFWPSFSKKCLKTPFLACVFLKYRLWRREFGQNRAFLVFWEDWEIQFDRAKKKGRQNFQKFFEIEKALDPPLFHSTKFDFVNPGKRNYQIFDDGVCASKSASGFKCAETQKMISI